MSATSKTFQVTLTSTGTAYDMSAINIILVLASGSGSKVLYNVNGAVPTYFIVDESPSTIAAASSYIIPLTNTANSTTFYINPDRVRDILTNGSGSNVYYNQGENEDKLFTVTETRAAIRSLIAGIVSSGSDSVTTGVTAFAGGGQGSATQLVYGFTEITVCATAGDSVKLPVGITGGKVTVLNDGAASADVFPSTGGTINDLAANTAVSVPPGNEVIFECINGTNWETSAQTLSAGNGTVSLPSITFSSDPDTGIYRIGANNIGVAANGAKVLDVATTGLTVTGATATTTTLNVGTDQTFTKEVNHTISVSTSTTANTAGANLTVSSATGVGTGAGGTMTISAGASGAGATGNGGRLAITAGSAASTDGNGGDVIVTAGALTGTGIGGQTILRSSANTPVLIKRAVAATGADAVVLTVAQLFNGIFVQTPTAATTTTTPTGAQISAALGASLAVGDSFDFSLINIGGTGDDITFTAGASGVTVTGNADVYPVTDAAADHSSGTATFRFVNTASNTWIAYRVA